VYDGFDKVLGKPVAIKVIKKKLFTTEKKRYLVQVEIDILSKMVHANIVKFERLLEDHKRVKYSLISDFNF
jgi:serine/threonine protein kinase